MTVGIESSATAGLETGAARGWTFREPGSAWTHFISFWVALFASGVLLMETWGSGIKFWSMAFYAIGFIGIFLASSCYHFFDFGERWNPWLRRADHVSIFVMIAGSYMPLLVHFLSGSWRFWMATAVLAVGTLGIVFKVLWITAPPWLGTMVYLAMGWMAVVAGPVILPAIPSVTLFWILLGGAIYSVGSIVYVKQWPDPWPTTFGHHEVWHLFVMGGAAAHFVAIWSVLSLPVP